MDSNPLAKTEIVYDFTSIDQITDNIWIGNEEAAYSKKCLEDRGITHILVAGNSLVIKFREEYTYR